MTIALPLKEPEKLIFRPKRLRYYLNAFLFLPLLLMFAVTAFKSGLIMPALALGGATIWLYFYAILGMLPNEGNLCLNADGFERYSHIKSHCLRHRWNEVLGFSIRKAPVGRFRTITHIYYYVLLGSMSREKQLSTYRYATSLEELAVILNEWKSRHAPLTEADNKLLSEAVLPPD